MTQWFDRQEKEELSLQKRNRKQKKKSPRPFPHAPGLKSYQLTSPVPREPLLEKVLDKHKETFQSPDNFSNTLAALQHEDFQGLVNLGFMILVKIAIFL